MSRASRSEFLSNRVKYIDIQAIRPNRQQPRRQFEAQGIQELADSIRVYGILQPLTVRRMGQFYELIAGERRLRAAKAAGLRQVPCIVARVGEEEVGMLALIENLQRRDLGYFEEARAIAGMVQRYALTQEQVAQKLGKSQSAIANKLRLLRLPPEVCSVLEKNNMTERHARVLLRLSDPQEQLLAAQDMAREQMNVARAEAYVEKLLHKLQQRKPTHPTAYILKDIRLFLNSIQHQVALICQSGIPAQWEREDNAEQIILTIRIPKQRVKVSVEK